MADRIRKFLSVRRLSFLVVGIVGLGRIGTPAALRFKAFGCRVVFFDPYLPANGRSSQHEVRSVTCVRPSPK